MVSHAGVSLRVLGRGPRASFSKMLPSLTHSQGQDRGKFGGGWPHLGVLFLVTGSLSQALGARVTGRELFAFPLALDFLLPGPKGDRATCSACCMNFSFLPWGLQPSCLSEAPTPLKGHQGHCFTLSRTLPRALAPGPPSGLMAVTGGRNNPSNPVICTGLSSRPSPPVCALS